MWNPAACALLVAISLACPSLVEAADVLPRPSSVEEKAGQFSLRDSTVIRVSASDANAQSAAKAFADALAHDAGLRLAIDDGAGTDGTIRFVTDTAVIGAEGYAIDVTPAGVVVRASGAAGLFYGAQTLRQLVPMQATQGVRAIKAIDVRDQPRYPWRGFLLDCSRHFMSVDYVKRTLDLMAMQKLNRFHWHLTDNAAWRLEIDAFPKLTEIGSRAEQNKPGGPPRFYSKDQVREVVRYANDRHIMVIPEIEMPGHSAAALQAYPELMCPGTKYAYCAGNEDVFPFLMKILDETIDLFGHQTDLIHIGGDERPKGAWEKCPKCSARTTELGLKSADELQEWFMRRMNDHVAKRGKRAISWGVTHSANPYAPTDLDDIGHNAIIHNWHGGAAFAARQGWDVINSANGSVYLDYAQFPTDKASKPKWMPLLPIEKVYAYDPTPPGLTPEQAKHILGGEACLWTELLPQADADYQTYPRLLAFAESVWSSAEGKDFADFSRRLSTIEPRLATYDVKFAKPATQPTE